MMKTDRSWSLDITPIYDDPEPLGYGPLTYHFETVLKSIRVAVKSGTREVVVFHAVRPEPPHSDVEENYIFTYRRMVDPHDNPLNLDLNPLNQLMADAELGRKVREAGLEFK
jgi:hypothetical protein